MAIAICCLVWWSVTGDSQASPGDLDPLYGTGGIAQAPIPVRPGSATRFAPIGFQPSGRLIALGASVYTYCDHSVGCLSSSLPLLAGLKPDGTLDPAFGDAGLLEPGFGVKGDGSDVLNVSDAQVLADGRILLATAEAGKSFVVVGLTPDGNLDPSFGDGGIARIADPDARGPRYVHIATQADGRIVLAGSSAPAPSNTLERLTLVRLEPDGTLDPTFGAGGFHYEDGMIGQAVSDVAVDDQDRIVTAEQWFLQPGVRRFHPDGSLDTGFGSDGIAAVDNPNPATSLEIGVAPDQGVVLLSTTHRVFRLTPNGDLDPAFGSAGMVDAHSLIPNALSFVYSAMDQPVGMAIAPDGKIVLSGANGNELQVSRLLSDGQPDPDFGVGGTSVSYPIEPVAPGAPIIDPQGRIVTVGGPGGLTSARFRTDHGDPDDRDADGVVDLVDECPGRYDAQTGCPSYGRTIGIRSARHMARGTVSLGDRRCPADDESVVVLAKRPGRDRRLATAPVRSQGDARKYRARIHVSRGTRVYALIAARFDPTVGICEGARSRTDRVGH
jgi:uncharacterized delta-60 repeat protein